MLTKDDKVRYRTLEQAAVAQAGMRFVLVSGNLSGAAMGEAFVKVLTAIEQFVQAAVGTVHLEGVQVW